MKKEWTGANDALEAAVDKQLEKNKIDEDHYTYYQNRQMAQPEKLKKLGSRSAMRARARGRSTFFIAGSQSGASNITIAALN